MLLFAWFCSLKVLTDKAIALKCELCACDFINAVSKHFTCMVACKKVLVVVYVFVLTCSFTFFPSILALQISVCRAWNKIIYPIFVNFKLDSRVYGISFLLQLPYRELKNLLLGLALKPEQNSCFVLGLYVPCSASDALQSLTQEVIVLHK